MSSILDKMVSYKRYVSNLIVANIIITIVWVLFSMNIIRNLGKDNSAFIQSSAIMIGSANVLCAYCGITGIIKRHSFELNAYSILSRIVIISEISIYLFILFTQHEWNVALNYQVSNSVLTGVAIILVLSQIWLLYETKAFESLVNLSDAEEFDYDRDLIQRRFSAPPNICDLEKNDRLFVVSNKLVINPAIETPMIENLINQIESRNEVNNNLLYDVSNSPSMPFVSQPVYQQLSQPLYDRVPQTYGYLQSCPSQAPHQIQKREDINST